MPTNETICAGLLMLREKYKSPRISDATCHGEPEWDVDGKHYCLMHAPTKEKSEEFDEVFRQKLTEKNYRFSGVWFPDHFFLGRTFEDTVHFDYATFSENFFFSSTFKEYADFSNAQFNGTVGFTDTVFEGRADFSGAHFNGDADFTEMVCGADCYFAKAKFNGEYTNFNAAKFKDVNFAKVQFSGGVADFSEAEFVGANFAGTVFSGGEVSFRRSKFSASANFYEAKFSGGNAIFSFAEFSGGVLFRKAEFSSGLVNFIKTGFSKKVDLSESSFFKQAYFDGTKFLRGSSIDLRRARFADFTRFMELDRHHSVDLYFGETIFEKPERVHFHSMNDLSPRWFINVDTRKFNFENVEYPLLNRRMIRSFPQLRKWVSLYQLVRLPREKRKRALRILDWRSSTEIELTKSKNLLIRLGKRANENFDVAKTNPRTLLITAYRRLAANAEENNRYEEAMGFRYLAMETHRQSALWRMWAPVTLHWWYWASSGYGERVWRATALLAFVWLVPFLFYMSPAAVFTREFRTEEMLGAITAQIHLGTSAQADPLPERTLRGLPPMYGALYSLQVMAFQKPEPKPAKLSPLTEWVVFAQTILGPVQAALLLLAIRRKFMR